jgi:hypothetical protein
MSQSSPMRTLSGYAALATGTVIRETKSDGNRRLVSTHHGAPLRGRALLALCPTRGFGDGYERDGVGGYPWFSRFVSRRNAGHNP